MIIVNISNSVLIYDLYHSEKSSYILGYTLDIFRSVLMYNFSE